MEQARNQAGPAPVAADPARAPGVRAAARPARARRRHWLLLLSFLAWVAIPTVLAGWYLYTVAYDQYASRVGFSVRTEEVGSAIELLGGITELSGSSSSDTDILYEFIQSQQMVRAINADLPLVDIYSPPGDPVFTLGDDARIEALSSYWQSMVKVFYDRASGLIEVRVLAFDPDDAQNVAQAIFDESSRMINDLSTIARADAMRYAEEELERAQLRLKSARQATTAFRNRTGIIDPQADIQGQMGLLNTLQSQLASALIERQLLIEGGTNPSDPRVVTAQRRIDAIRNQIAEERAQFGTQAPAQQDPDGEEGYSRLLEEYESLQVDQEFAQKAFLSALATRDTALAEAQRQSRYLASFVSPTRAETPEYPRRLVLLGLVLGALFVTWAIGVMIYYSLRDRR